MARAGAFRDQVTFEQLAGGSIDAYGNPTDAWATLAVVWADIREVPGKESLAAGRLEATRGATIRVRASSTLSAVGGADRVIARGETWNIRSGPVQIGRKGAVLEFIIETGVAA